MINRLSILDISQSRLKFVFSINPSPSTFLPGADLRLIWICSPSYNDASIDLSIQFYLSIGSNVSRWGHDLMWKILKIGEGLQWALLRRRVGEVKTTSCCPARVVVI